VVIWILVDYIAPSIHQTARQSPWTALLFRNSIKTALQSRYSFPNQSYQSPQKMIPNAIAFRFVRKRKKMER